MSLQTRLSALITAIGADIKALDAADKSMGTPNAKTASYTLVLSDAGKAVQVTTAAASTVTIPPNSSVAFPVGTVIEIDQMGAGTVSVVAGAGVTVRSRNGLLNLGGQYAAATIRKIATDEWLLVGDVV